MTDLEKLQNVFQELGIEYEMEIDKEDERRLLTIDKGIGYSGFHAEFRFDKNGKFVEYGVWE